MKPDNPSPSAAAVPLCAILTTDLTALTRGRSFPADRLGDYIDHGIGWVPANMAINCFNDIVPHPWGSSGDLRVIPDPATEVRVKMASAPTLALLIGDIVALDGSPWSCCARSLLKAALKRFRAETGLDPIMAFEHEFRLLGATWADEPAFTLQAMRRAAGFGEALISGLRQAGTEPEMLFPEYGRDQFEITVAPASALIACDRAVVLREVTRDIARQWGLRASFSPKPTPDDAASGVHVHISLNGPDGNTTFDPARPGRLSGMAAHFAAGIAAHLPAITAFTAPTPVSYLRLVEHSWSAAYAIVGERNREAALRICPTFPIGGPHEAAQFNFEFRACDATANPYLTAALLILAGLEGIRARLPLPPLVNVDPSELPEDERGALQRLPQNLEDALDALRQDTLLSDWLPPEMLDCHIALKTSEIAAAAGLAPTELCARYAAIY